VPGVKLARGREGKLPAAKPKVLVADRAKRGASAIASALLLAFGNHCGRVAADKLVSPQRNQSIEVVYRLDQPTTAQGSLDIEWSDLDLHGSVFGFSRVSTGRF
jgi:hypothetical protein